MVTNVPTAMLAGPGPWQPFRVALAGGAEEVLGVVEELLEALVVQLVAALTRPRDGVQIKGGAADGACFARGAKPGARLSGVEAVSQPCLE